MSFKKQVQRAFVRPLFADGGVLKKFRPDARNVQKSEAQKKGGAVLNTAPLGLK